MFNPYDPEEKEAHQWCSDHMDGTRWFDIGQPCTHPEWHEQED